MIRPLEPHDAKDFRALRLFALADSPAAFASSVTEEEAEGEADFAARLTRADDGVVLGAFEGEALVGMVGFYRDARLKTRHKGHVWGVFVRPERRGRGYAGALLRAVLDHARGLEGLFQVHLEVGSQNVPALRLYESVGFSRFGVEPRGLIVAGRSIDEVMLVHPLTPFEG